MSYLSKAISKYRRDGIRGVIKRAVSGRTSDPMTDDYQVKLEAAFEARWAMVKAHLPADVGSLVDFGSNLGAFTARAAREGLVSIGVEKMPGLVRKARQLNADVADCAFLHSEVDQAFLDKLPRFDVALLLSVHHHWHGSYGSKQAADMFRSVLTKTDRVLIFEGAARATRFEKDIPDFADNDEKSVLAYYDKYLAETVGDLCSSITMIGKAECVGEREPFRWMYALTR